MTELKVEKITIRRSGSFAWDMTPDQALELGRLLMESIIIRLYDRRGKEVYITVEEAKQE